MNLRKYNRHTCNQVPQGFILGMLLNNIINIKSVSTPVLFADESSIIITEPDVSYLVESSYCTFTVRNKWFIANKIYLNFDKTNITFVTNDKPIND
jgi:hypothetical protein